MKIKPLKSRNTVLAILVSAILVCSVLCGACGPVIARFDAAALETLVVLKARSLVLLEKAAEPYDRHRDECEEIVKLLEQAYHNAAQKADNGLAVKQWEMLKNPGGYLLGGVLEKWRQEGQLESAFCREAREIIAAAFDSMIGLENGKPRR